MNFVDPFFGYSFLLRTIVYVVVPAFTAFQFVRMRRGLHVFQLEGYKRRRFLQWCRENPARARFLSPAGSKKPLAMTGRAWRIVVLATLLNLGAALVLPAMAHLSSGAPWDILTWVIVTFLLFFGAPQLLTAADWLLIPVQATINGRYRRRALGKIERFGPTVIGITGSFGKTSTKFAIAGLLDAPAEAFATPGSYNTPMGVVRAINEGLEDSHRFLVVEMGAYRQGDIAELVSFVRPTVGVLTAIGPAHLERFGSMEAIRRAKYEIVEGLPSHGTAVMNVDDPEVRVLADRTEHVKVIRYGIDAGGSPNVSARDISYSSGGTTLTIVDAGGNEVRVTTKLLGSHAIGHILAAVAVAGTQNLALADLRGRIGALEPVEHRLQLIRGAGGVTVIDDAFNSNPAGAAAALDVLAGMDAGKKIVITPGIVELGELQQEENERFGEHAGRVADVVIVVGRVNRDAIVTGAERGTAEVIVVDRLVQATDRLHGLVSAGDVVLFENDLPDQYED